MKENKEMICFRLNPNVIKLLRKASIDLKKTKVWIVEEALIQYFKQHVGAN